jgi:hypothetical protein
VLKSCSRKAKIDWEYYFNAYEIYTREHPALSATMDTDQLYESLNSAIVLGSEFSPFLYHSSLRERVPLDWENVWRKLGFLRVYHSRDTNTYFVLEPSSCSWYYWNRGVLLGSKESLGKFTLNIPIKNIISFTRVLNLPVMVYT